LLLRGGLFAVHFVGLGKWRLRYTRLAAETYG
jgi:hypothetical protein